MSTTARSCLGHRGEALAAEHLERLGFSVVARNHRTRWGEIDIIASDEKRMLVFAEVKTRRAGSGHPFDALGPTKQRQVRRMASSWLAETAGRPWTSSLRFDAIGVVIDARGELVCLEHLEGAF